MEIKLYNIKVIFLKVFLKVVDEKYFFYEIVYNCRVDIFNNGNEIYLYFKRCNKVLFIDIFVLFRYGNERNES